MALKPKSHNTGYAGDKVFALTRTDGLFVFTGGDRFERLGHFDFKGDTSVFNASPAAMDGKLLLRSDRRLYCIGNP